MTNEQTAMSSNNAVCLALCVRRESLIYFQSGKYKRICRLMMITRKAEIYIKRW